MTNMLPRRRYDRQETSNLLNLLFITTHIGKRELHQGSQLAGQARRRGTCIRSDVMSVKRKYCIVT